MKFERSIQLSAKIAHLFFYLIVSLEDKKKKEGEFIRICCHNDSQELNMEDNLVSLFNS
jgi:hypothetical protein